MVFKFWRFSSLFFGGGGQKVKAIDQSYLLIILHYFICENAEDTGTNYRGFVKKCKVYSIDKGVRVMVILTT